MISRCFCVALLGAPLVLSSLVAQEGGAQESAPEAAEALDPERLKGWIEALGSEDFRLRQTAQAALEKAAQNAPDAVAAPGLDTFFSSTDPELRYRLRDVLYLVHEAQFTRLPQGFLGIEMRASNVIVAKNAQRELKASVMISNIVAESAAEEVGLQPGDQILQVDDVAFSTETDASNEFMKYVGGKLAGDVVTLKVLREQVERTVKVALGERPPELKVPETPRETQIMQSRFEAWLLAQSEKKDK